MTKTKQDSEFSGKDENTNCSPSVHLNDSLKNSVINVEFCGKKDNPIMRLDLMRISGDEGRYYSISYSLNTENGTNGLFDFLDDYYSKRFGIFTSNKTTQALLLALHKIEKKFYKNNCFDFIEYCELISGNSLEKITKDKRFSNAVASKIIDGYSIGDESKEMYSLKHGGIKSGGHIEKFGKELKAYFESILDEMNKKKFCCVCITNTEKIPQSFLIDPSVGLPLIIYDFEFAEEFFKKNFKPLVESDIFKNAEIRELSVDLWAVAPDVTVKQITSIVGEDGELTIEYDDEEMENTDMFLGKFKTISFNKKKYSNENWKHNTVIGYV